MVEFQRANGDGNGWFDCRGWYQTLANEGAGDEFVAFDERRLLCSGGCRSLAKNNFGGGEVTYRTSRPPGLCTRPE